MQKRRKAKRCVNPDCQQMIRTPRGRGLCRRCHANPAIRSLFPGETFDLSTRDMTDEQLKDFIDKQKGK